VTRARDIFALDVFTGPRERGNRAAVVLLEDWPHHRSLASIARAGIEAARGCDGRPASAAALVVARAPSDGEPRRGFDIRWFSAHGEIALCGHGALAAAHGLLDRGASDRVIHLASKDQLIEARRGADHAEIALGEIACAPCAGPPSAQAFVPALVGENASTIREIWRSARGYVVVFFDREEHVLALKPDFAALKRFGAVQFIGTAPGREADIVSRVFVPGAGVSEDDATASAHAALAPLWGQRLGKARLTALQASPQGGRLALARENGRVWIGGQCRRVAGLAGAADAFD